MLALSTKYKGKIFYIAYFFLICLYVIAIRLKTVPMSLTYILYGLGIILFTYELFKKGFYFWKGKYDVIAISLFVIYYLISSLIFVSFDANSPSWIIKDYLYSLIPMFFYVILRLSKLNFNIQILLLSTWASVIIIDIFSLFILLSPGSFISGLFTEEFIEFDGTFQIALSGVIGVILTGFINVIGLIICVFSPIRLNRIIVILSALFFSICIFMTGQRTPVVGIFLILFLVVLKNKTKGLFVVATLSLILAMSLPFLKFEIEGIPVKDVMVERTMNRFTQVKEGNTGRNNQYKIYNDEYLFGFLIGDGVGRHSPENEKAKHSTPDAMWFRIYNEMGLIGVLLYLAFFYFNFVRSVKSKNWFAISLILYIFIANSFNRVLFTAPISIIPYALLACFNWRNTNSYEIYKTKKPNNIIGKFV